MTSASGSSASPEKKPMLAASLPTEEALRSYLPSTMPTAT